MKRLSSILCLLLLCSPLVGCDQPKVDSREVNRGWRLVKRANGGYSFYDSNHCYRFGGDRDDWKVLFAAFNEMEKAEK